MNHGSRWLFPGTRVGHHITEQTVMQRFRRLGIDIRAVRNTALHELSKEIDAASLADLLGYTPRTMNIHAARAAVPMASYPAIHRPEPRTPGPGVAPGRAGRRGEPASDSQEPAEDRHRAVP